MIFLPTTGHQAQIDLIGMVSSETDGGYERIVWYQKHHYVKSDIGEMKDKNTTVIALIVIQIMASCVTPNILQSENGG